MLYIFLSLYGIAFLFFIITFIKPIYMFVFEHEEWKLWRYFYKNVDKFEFIQKNFNSYEFKWGEYIAYIWKDGHSSIHTANDCICCSFWGLKSRKFANKLLEKKNKK